MAMNMNKLTEKAQEAIVAAQRLAEERHHTQLEPEHLLHALVAQEDGVVPAILGRLEIPANSVLEGLEPALSGFARSSGPTQVQASNRFRRVFEAAAREADRLKDDYVSTEHFLLALADDAETGAAGQTLRRLGVTRDRLYIETMQQVFNNTTKVMVDSRQGNQLLYLPFDRLMQQALQDSATPRPAPPATEAPPVPDPSRSRDTSLRSRDREAR